MKLDLEDLRELLKIHGNSPSRIAEALGMPRSTFRGRCEQVLLDMLKSGVRDPELVADNVRLAKGKQKAQDVTRIERKAFREHARVENAVSELSRQIVDLLKRHEFKPPPAAAAREDGAGAIIHWSDQHLNERVELAHNRYDWEVAAKRLRQHVVESLRLCEAYGVGDVFVAMTGDLLNSDRRLDELLANAGNRAKACVLAADLYQQALKELRAHVNVTVGCVSGNESRIPKEVGWHPEVASDNYDFTIYEILRLLLDDKGISFVERSADPSELLIHMAGQHVLFLHGHGAVTKGDIQKSVQSVKGRYIARGQPVDLVFWGHLHESLIADEYGRSSSLVGANDYGEKALNYGGRASQNLYILLPSGGFHGFKLDLQNPAVDGYQIRKALEAYNTKSAAKVNPGETVVRVVI